MVCVVEFYFETNIEVQLNLEAYIIHEITLIQNEKTLWNKIEHSTCKYTNMKGKAIKIEHVPLFMVSGISLYHMF